MASICYHATGGQPWHRKKLNRACEKHSQTAIFPGISKKSVSKSHMLSLTVCASEFLNNSWTCPIGLWSLLQPRYTLKIGRKRKEIHYHSSMQRQVQYSNLILYCLRGSVLLFNFKERKMGPLYPLIHHCNFVEKWIVINISSCITPQLEIFK